MNVYITKAAKFLPNAPVGNDEMEDYLGLVDGKPSKARTLILSRNGIKSRYYALDREGNVTHTNVQMAANAVRGLLDENFTLDDIDVLSCGTATPEQVMPSHGVMVHGELGGKRNIEVVSFAGSCCAGVDALKYACMAVELDPTVNAVASASERMSAWMRACYFQKESEQFHLLKKRPILAFQKDFLRWMLSDGAYALLLQSKPSENQLSLKVEWVEITSFAHQVKTCMYAGGEKDENGDLHGWASFPEEEWLNQSLFALKQDVELLAENIVPLGVDYLLQLFEKHNFKPEEVDWFLPHLSSMYFKDKIMEGSAAKGFVVPEEKWFINLPRIGNIASASGFAMLEELMYSGKLQKGQTILMMIPESARFSYCYALFTVC